MERLKGFPGIFFQDSGFLEICSCNSGGSCWIWDCSRLAILSPPKHKEISVINSVSPLIIFSFMVRV